MEYNTMEETFIKKVLDLGAYKANVIKVSDVSFDRVFRDMCKSNFCGNYGKCWTCPPDCGDIDEMIAEAQKFEYVLVYQTVGQLEDSYDFETMMEVGHEHNVRVQQVRKLFLDKYNGKTLHLGAGGCQICEVCAKKTNEPCRDPENAPCSLEAYGINVSKLAEASGMKYINGQDTVTYFGAVFFGYENECKSNT